MSRQFAAKDLTKSNKPSKRGSSLLRPIPLLPAQPLDASLLGQLTQAGDYIDQFRKDLTYEIPFFMQISS